MSAPRAVLVGPDRHMRDLTARAGVDGDVLTFSEAQPLEAFEAIIRALPPLVVLERRFAATPRGVALIARLTAEPAIRQAVILVRAHDGPYARVVSRPDASGAPAAPASAAPATTRPVGWHGTRRVPRFRIHSGTAVQVDGTPVSLIDLSVTGAQILSATSLRPSRRVRLMFADDLQTLRFGATIVWASFEMSGSGPRYRAGLEFLDADPAALQPYCDRHRAD